MCKANRCPQILLFSILANVLYFIFYINSQELVYQRLTFFNVILLIFSFRIPNFIQWYHSLSPPFSLHVLWSNLRVILCRTCILSAFSQSKYVDSSSLVIKVVLLIYSLQEERGRQDYRFSWKDCFVAELTTKSSIN